MLVKRACLSSPKDLWTRLSARTSMRCYTLKSVDQSLEELREKMLYKKPFVAPEGDALNLIDVLKWHHLSCVWSAKSRCWQLKPLIHIYVPFWHSYIMYHITLTLTFSCLTRLSHLEMDVVVIVAVCQYLCDANRSFWCLSLIKVRLFCVSHVTTKLWCDWPQQYTCCWCSSTFIYVRL